MENAPLHRPTGYLVNGAWHNTNNCGVWGFENFVRRPTRIATDGSNTTTAQVERPVNVNKCLSLFFITVGIYALATGLWASMTWPLPGPYNLMYSDAWPIFGLVSLMLGLAMYLGVDLRYLSLPIALFSIPDHYVWC